MFLLIAPSLLFQDPPPGEVIATSPRRPAAAADLPPSSAPAPEPVDEAEGFESLFGPSPLASLGAEEPRDAGDDVWDAFDEAMAAPPPDAPHGRLGFPLTHTPDPLPPEALSDPVRYAADQCRPGVRPQDEDVAACFDRIERAVRDEETRRRDARRPRATCTQRQTRNDDGRTTESSARCVIGTGDPALADRLFDWN